MSSMQLTQRYDMKIKGITVRDVRMVEEWNGLIEFDAGPSKGKIIVRRKGWNSGKHWAKEANAFIDQEIDVIFADERIGLPPTEVIFSKPEAEG